MGHIIAGIDIGHAAVKVVGIRSGRKPEFIGCKEIRLDHQYLVRDGFPDHQIVTRAIQEALKTAAPKPIKARELVITISESVVFRKIFDLEQLPESQMTGAVRLAASEFLPDVIDQMEVDYQPLISQLDMADPVPVPAPADPAATQSEKGNDESESTVTSLANNPSSTVDSTKQSVMAVAVSGRFIQDFMKVAKLGKFTVRAIEPKANALTRAIVQPNLKNAVVLVDVGSETTTISLAYNHAVWIASTINVGANIIRNPGTGEIEQVRIAPGIEKLIETLAEEVERVVRFFASRERVPAAQVPILLTGGGSNIAGFAEAYAVATSRPVSPAQSLIKIPAFCDRRFYGALGAALYTSYEAY
jgi:Tfp pilus assembly PilM family ATPase